MTRILTIIALLISPIVLHAEQAGKPPHKCAMMGQYAKLIMDMRQSGLEMSEWLEKIEGQFPVGGEQLKATIIMAYEEKRWSSQDKREDAANRFRNRIELMCYRSQK